MIENILNMLKKDYKLIENDKFARLKATGMLGLMKMDMLMINPFEKDAPLLSYDRIWAFGNDTMIMELYDTTLNHNFILDGFTAIKDRYAQLPFYNQGEHWYDSLLLGRQSIHVKGKKKKNEGFDSLAEEFFKEYVDCCRRAEAAEAEAKKAKAKEYIDGLLNNGGPLTDIFIKKFGKEFTGELFADVLFGTGK